MFGLAKFTSKCFVILCQNPTISTTDCCMESICCNTEIPAVIVCPERDYRIFLNWSSIHLSIKTQPKARNVKRVSSAPEAFTMPKRTVRTSPLKRLIFWNFIIPVVPCFYITLYQILLASTMWKQWNMLSSVICCWISTRPLVTSQASVILVTSSGYVKLCNGGIFNDTKAGPLRYKHYNPEFFSLEVIKLKATPQIHTV